MQYGNADQILGQKNIIRENIAELSSKARRSANIVSVLFSCAWCNCPVR